jgi:hypothetical protein
MPESPPQALVQPPNHRTVRRVLPAIVPEVAVMVAVPPATAAARPPLLTVAAALFDELQVTCVVISWLVPSEYAPEAANCWVNPTWILGLAGMTNMEERVAEVTVKVVLPDLVPEAAVMVAVPAAMVVAKPLPSTVANDVWEELQVTCAVISWLVPSEYMPKAANCRVTPAGRVGLAGVTDMKDRVADVTVRVALTEVVVPEVSVEAAVMVVVPGAMAVAKPLPSTVATAGSDEFQVTCGLIS